MPKPRGMSDAEYTKLLSYMRARQMTEPERNDFWQQVGYLVYENLPERLTFNFILMNAGSENMEAVYGAAETSGKAVFRIL